MDAEALFDAALVAAGENESSLQLDGAATALSARAARAAVPRPPVKMSMNRKRGTFSGTLRLGAKASQVKKFQGVILQQQNSGAGYVKLDGGGTGEVGGDAEIARSGCEVSQGLGALCNGRELLGDCLRRNGVTSFRIG